MLGQGYVTFFSVFYLAMYVSFLSGSKISNHTFEVQFSPSKPGAQQTKNLKTTVNRRGRIREFDMKKGAWNIIITSHSSMLLLVSLPICQILELRYKIYRFTSRTPSFFSIGHFPMCDKKVFTINN